MSMRKQEKNYGTPPTHKFIKNETNQNQSSCSGYFNLFMTRKSISKKLLDSWAQDNIFAGLLMKKIGCELKFAYTWHEEIQYDLGDPILFDEVLNNKLLHSLTT